MSESLLGEIYYTEGSLEGSTVEEPNLSTVSEESFGLMKH